LGWAAIGAPVYVAVSLGQAFTRPGFDLTRHPLSVNARPVQETGPAPWRMPESAAF
jgi:hypothetical protein